MPIALKCFIVVVLMAVIGIVLRTIAESELDADISWSKNGKLALSQLRKKNALLAALISLEGVIGNVSLAGMIVGIPLYFIWGI